MVDAGPETWNYSHKAVDDVNNETKSAATEDAYLSILCEKLGRMPPTEGTYPSSDVTVEYLVLIMQEMSAEEAFALLKEILFDHSNDSNFDSATAEQLKLIVAGDENNARLQLEARAMATIIAHYSPYPEVRSVTTPFDDPNIPAETFRAYLLGVVWAVVASGVNTFFVPRMPSISLSTSMIQFLICPLGKLLHLILPTRQISIYGKRFTLNHNVPWTFKEQMFVTLMVSVSNGGAYAAVFNIMTQKLKVYYGDEWVSIGYQVLLVVSTQFLGFGFAGLLRKVVVYPTQAMWPTILPTLALGKALCVKERESVSTVWKWSQFKTFIVFLTISFSYFWVPNYLVTALNNFNWMCWIKPSNFNVNAITGMHGLGLNPIPTFDWNVISFSAPMAVPFPTIVNQFVGMLLGAIVIASLYWTNYRWTAHLPINSNLIYDNQGRPYHVQRVLKDGLFDRDKYKAYSPPFYTASNLVVYGAFLALYPFAIVDVFLTHWQTLRFACMDMIRGLKSKNYNVSNEKDPHCRMMLKYKEVPNWWFLILLGISLVCAILCVVLYPTKTPVWGIFFTVAINFVFLVPISVLASITGFTFGLNVLVELIVGYAIPGNGTALMILKAFGYNIDGQAESYISNQKLAHYAKLSPRAIFRGQILAAIIQIVMSLLVVNWQIANIKDICQPGQISNFVCPSTNTYYAASVIWGAIGPKITFNGLYPILQWCFLIGAMLPAPLYYLRRRYPSKLVHFHPTVVIGGFLSYAPYSMAYLIPGLYVSIVFMHYLRKNYVVWWETYNYVIYSALSAGVGLSAIVIFFSVQYHPKLLVWRGNTISSDTIDGGKRLPQSLLSIPDAGYFGPGPNEYPGL